MIWITNFLIIEDLELSKKTKNKEVNLEDPSSLKIQEILTSQDNKLIRTKKKVKDHSVNDLVARVQEMQRENQKTKEKWQIF